MLYSTGTLALLIVDDGVDDDDDGVRVGEWGGKVPPIFSHENMKLDFTSSYLFLSSSRASLVHNMNT